MKSNRGNNSKDPNNKNVIDTQKNTQSKAPTCCFCIPLDVWVWILAIISLAYAVIAVLSIPVIFVLVETGQFGNSSSLDKVNNDSIAYEAGTDGTPQLNPLFFLVFLALGILLYLLPASILVHGLRRRRPKCLRVVLVFRAAFLAISILGMIFVVWVGRGALEGGKGVGTFVIYQGIWLWWELNYIWVLRNYANAMEEEANMQGGNKEPTHFNTVKQMSKV